MAGRLPELRRKQRLRFKTATRLHFDVERQSNGVESKSNRSCNHRLRRRRMRGTLSSRPPYVRP